MGRALALALVLAAAPALADATLPAASQAPGGEPGMRVGATVKIVDAGQLYTTIDRCDCMSAWPSEAIRGQTDEEYWKRNRLAEPRNGDVGVVLFEAHHCDPGHDGKPVRLLILRLGVSRYAVIGSTGLRALASRR
jgi:hypothetical protein